MEKESLFFNKRNHRIVFINVIFGLIGACSSGVEQRKMRGRSPVALNTPATVAKTELTGVKESAQMILQEINPALTEGARPEIALQSGARSENKAALEESLLPLPAPVLDQIESPESTGKEQGTIETVQIGAVLTSEEAGLLGVNVGETTETSSQIDQSPVTAAGEVSEASISDDSGAAVAPSVIAINEKEVENLSASEIPSSAGASEMLKNLPAVEAEKEQTEPQIDQNASTLSLSPEIVSVASDTGVALTTIKMNEESLAATYSEELIVQPFTLEEVKFHCREMERQKWSYQLSHLSKAKSSSCANLQAIALAYQEKKLMSCAYSVVYKHRSNHFGNLLRHEKSRKELQKIYEKIEGKMIELAALNNRIEKAMDKMKNLAVRYRCQEEQE